MKKIIAFIALLSCGAAAAYGADFTFPTAAGTKVMGSSGRQIDFKPSANVAMVYEASTSSGVSYVVGSVHGQGSKAFGTSSVDTNIFYQDVVAPGIPSTAGATATVKTPSGTTITFPTTSTTTPTTYFSSGWTASK